MTPASIKDFFIQKLTTEDKSSLSTQELNEIVSAALKQMNLEAKALTSTQMMSMVQGVVEGVNKKKSLKLAQLIDEKDRLITQIESTKDEIQALNQQTFDTLEELFVSMKEDLSDESFTVLREAKLQSVDMLDILQEVTESAIITTLEKGDDIEKTIYEITRNLTVETLHEGNLSAERIKKVTSTIIKTAIDIAEATPNKAEEILKGTLKGVKNGVKESISRFKERLAYVPSEAKALLSINLDSLYEELKHADVLFLQTVKNQSLTSSRIIKETLNKIVSSMHIELEELLSVSKEALEAMKEKLSTLSEDAKKGALKIKTSIEAKRIGYKMWDVAKNKLETALTGSKKSQNLEEKADSKES